MSGLLATLRGIGTATFIVLSLFLLFFPFFLPLALIKLLVPHFRFRLGCTRAMVWVAWRWMACIDFAMDHIARQKIVIDNPVQNRPEARLLLISNHQSWADILVLIRVLAKSRLPFPRFFIKQQMIWVPIIGFATWALDFPYMKRYSREQVEKNPSLKGQDLETTRRACEIYRHQPVAVINFAEGTRSTAAKRQASGSPYKRLLKPKAGGTAFMLYAMGDVLDEVLEVAVVYRGSDNPTIWQYWCGTLPEVRAIVRPLAIPREYYGRDYQNDAEFQDSFRNWMNDYWAGKDKEIIRLHAGEAED